MRYVAAYCLARLGGNANPTAADIKSILGSVGIEAEDDRIAKVIKELDGKDLAEVVAEGREKLASVPSGGAVAASGGGAAPAAAAEEKAEEKKEEKKEESEESDEDMGFGLFD
uniref:Large ribosomal subunit protein P2 n=1 Tax=Eurythoe complanata TaxID=167815 RepID=A8UGI4_EURCO|nr:ribosomal protein rplp2 [Eurythoe complanata]